METNRESALDAFRRAADRVPAYQELLRETQIDPREITTAEAFQRLPVLEKRHTFQRFKIEDLCVDGRLGRLGSVLTSSGHSGVFAFGLTEAEALPATARGIDDFLDAMFSVRSKPTLLINCLPMGVKVPTEACTLAETSVRPDMAVGLVRAFGRHYAQIILVGETAFIKHVLELGQKTGVDWKDLLVHVAVGEETLAENARIYLEHILGTRPSTPADGVIFSSMGVAELGLNLFAEAPPLGALVAFRRALHLDPILRETVLGPSGWVPSLFTYDPGRIFVEFGPGGRLILTTLDLNLRLPLIRYATGDRGHFVSLRPELREPLEKARVPWTELQTIPIVAISGRGEHVLSGNDPVYPEAVKEGIYHDPALAALTTANFRLAARADRAQVRVQLSPGIEPTTEMEQAFQEAITPYARTALKVVCQAYGDFGSGMTLDYERKFTYLEQ